MLSCRTPDPTTNQRGGPQVKEGPDRVSSAPPRAMAEKASADRDLGRVGMGRGTL